MPKPNLPMHPDLIETPAQAFAVIYAAGVVEHLKSGLPQGINYSVDDVAFLCGPLDEGTSPTDVGLWVGSGWATFVGKLDAEPATATDEELEALRQAIAQKLLKSGLAEACANSLIHQAHCIVDESDLQQGSTDTLQ